MRPLQLFRVKKYLLSYGAVTISSANWIIESNNSLIINLLMIKTIQPTWYFQGSIESIDDKDSM